MRLLLVTGMLLITTPLCAAITSSISASNQLIVSTTDGEDCIITIESGFVKVNGADPDTGPLPIADMTSFSFGGDSLSNRVDVSAITTADFASFGQLRIDTRGGDDVIVGSEFNDFIIPGDGVDTIEAFNGGFDLYEWAPGDGSETVSNAGGSGSVRLLYQGSTGGDDLVLSAVGNTLTVTNNNTMETVSLENPGSLGLQMNDGIDVVQANDMSSLSWTEPINCNKNSGSLDYNGLNSNQEINVFTNGGACTIQVTPFTDCSFSLNQLFGTPNNIDVTKQGEDVKIDYSLPGGTHLLRNMSDISLGGSTVGETITVADIGSASLARIDINPGRGSDIIETVFQTSTLIDIFERTSSGVDSNILRVDAEGKVVVETQGKLETEEGFGDITYQNVEVIEVLNKAPETDEFWIVK